MCDQMLGNVTLLWCLGTNPLYLNTFLFYDGDHGDDDDDNNDDDEQSWDWVSKVNRIVRVGKWWNGREGERERDALVQVQQRNPRNLLRA